MFMDVLIHILDMCIKGLVVCLIKESHTLARKLLFDRTVFYNSDLGHVQILRRTIAVLVDLMRAEGYQYEW